MQEQYGRQMLQKLTETQMLFSTVLNKIAIIATLCPVQSACHSYTTHCDATHSLGHPSEDLIISTCRNLGNIALHLQTADAVVITGARKAVLKCPVA